MAFDRIKISTLVPSQLPEFVRTDYQTFIAFIQAYYDYMEETGVAIDMDTIRDLDESVGDFIEHIKAEIAPKIPFNIADNRFKAQRLRDLYDAKGSASSFKLLFRMLYSRETDVIYPSQQMLIPSDGRWTQPYSIFVNFTEFSHDPFNLTGKLVTINNNGIFVQLFVERVEAVTILDSNGALQISPTTFQLYIGKNYSGLINTGNVFTFVDDTYTFSGKLVDCSTKINIIQGGEGFKLGELYNIKTSTGIGALMKINKVDANGAILAAELIGAGINYTSSFTTSLLAKQFNSSGAVLPAFSVTTAGSTITVGLSESTDPMVDYGIISKYDYTTELDYWDNSFVGTAVSSFYDVGSAIIQTSNLSANIELITGPVVKYPGYFATNNGFLSDAMYIQDSKYYQTFSYVVKLDRTLDTYAGILKSLLHPAGTALFGEFNLNDEFNLSPTVESNLGSTT